ncbi:helix-turn-helix domain-containing protein [Streptomyces sp. NBC_01476]|uniref:hypothetical protein n=1 Tax=Streptomyces sp. NBC_01476 TaxID=2903881 RepID=UPI002E31CE0E|nr:hypothetical protein [Streptomyces sp. NBC_01476]
MRINLSARTRAFTVLGNEVLRDRRLSFTARGILAYLLSLPDGAREDVRSLADKNPGLGRRGVAKAVDELIALGYYVRRTVRDESSGQVRTETLVFDTPKAGGAPLPASAGTGGPAVGKAGAKPKKNPGEEPTLPRQRPGRGAQAIEAAAVAHTTPEALARGASLLARLTRAEPRLALNAADTLALAPLAAQWVEEGVPERDARSLLTSGLPPVIHSARAILANRLVRKRPTLRKRQGSPLAAALAECGTCRDPLPRGHDQGTCPTCSGSPATPKPAPLPPETVAEHAAGIRALLRNRARGVAAPA